MPKPSAAPESRLREAKGRLSKCTHSGRSHHLEAKLMDLWGGKVCQERHSPGTYRADGCHPFGAYPHVLLRPQDSLCL